MSRLWEMEVLNDKLDALHGEKVGIGMLLCLREYKRIGEAISQGRCQVKEYGGMEEELLRETFGAKGVLDGIRAENTPDPLEEIAPEVLEECLPQIAEIIEELPDPEEMEDDDYFNFDDFDDSAFDDEPIDVDLGEKFSGIKAGAAEKYDEVKDAVKEKAEQAADSVMEKAEDAAKKAEDLAEAAKERAREAADAVSDGIDQASEALKQKFDEAEEKFDETIEDYKAKKNRFRFFD